MTLDVQYGSVAAATYDPPISSAVPADDVIARLRPYLDGARVLEIGVGTGRIAIPAAALAAELVGMDNSAAMLEVCRAKPLPENLSLVEADFRRPLPISGPFDLAYTALGSLAYVDSSEQLRTALGHVREVLRPGGTVVLDFYSTVVYRQLADLHQVTVPAPQGGMATFTVTIDDADRLTMATRLEEEGKAPVSFEERVLLLEPDAVTECLAAAGFTVDQVDVSDGSQTHDWYVAHRNE